MVFERRDSGLKVAVLRERWAAPVLRLLVKLVQVRWIAGHHAPQLP
jgi:hypothetical protein